MLLADDLDKILRLLVTEETSEALKPRQSLLIPMSFLCCDTLQSYTSLLVLGWLDIMQKS